MPAPTAIWLADLLRAQADLAPDAEARREIATLLGLGGIGPPAQAASQAEAAASAIAQDTAAAADRPEPPPAAPAPVAAPEAADGSVRLLSTIERIGEAQTAGPPPWLTGIEALTVQASPPPRPPIVDITCDSDGKIDRFIENDGVDETLSLHALRPGEPYYLAMFMTGAYQDIMGDMHNLFGRVNEIHVFVDDEDPEDFYIEEVIPGDPIEQVLSRMQYGP